MELRLTKFSEADFAAYLQLVQDEAVMAMITERALSLEEAQADYEKLLLNNSLQPDLGTFKVSNAVDNSFIGLAKLEVEEAASQEAELGYIVCPAYWGQGVGSKIAALLIELAHSQAQLLRLHAIIDPANIASRKILVKNNFTHLEYQDFDGLPGEILGLTL